jgi:hypothetical protein
MKIRTADSFKKSASLWFLRSAKKKRKKIKRTQTWRKNDEKESKN